MANARKLTPRQQDSKQAKSVAKAGENAVFNKVFAAIKEQMHNNHNLPTMAQLERLTGLSAIEIETAIDAQAFDPKAALYVALTRQVVLALYEAATEERSVSALKLWFSLMGFGPDSQKQPADGKDEIVINLGAIEDENQPDEQTKSE